MAKYSDSIETDKAYEDYVRASHACTDPIERLKLCRSQLVVERDRFAAKRRSYPHDHADSRQEASFFSRNRYMQECQNVGQAGRSCMARYERRQVLNKPFTVKLTGESK